MYHIMIQTKDPKKALDLLVELGNWSDIVTTLIEGGPDFEAKQEVRSSGRKQGRQARARFRWTEDDDAKLAQMRDENRSVGYMARELGRSKQAVEHRLYYNLPDSPGRQNATKSS